MPIERIFLLSNQNRSCQSILPFLWAGVSKLHWLSRFPIPFLLLFFASLRKEGCFVFAPKRYARTTLRLLFTVLIHLEFLERIGLQLHEG